MSIETDDDVKWIERERKFRKVMDLPLPRIDLAEINRQMNEVVEPAVTAHNLWSAIQRGDLRALNDGLRNVELRERLRQERQDEYVPRYRCREDQEADDAGQPRWGEL